MFDRNCFRLQRSGFSLHCLIKIVLFTRIKTHNVLQLAVYVDLPKLSAFSVQMVPVSVPDTFASVRTIRPEKAAT